MASDIPAYSDSLEWITAYLTAHSLSVPSWRYSFLVWLTVAFVSLVYAVLHCTSSGTGFLRAVWSKWSLRRRTWRKKHTLALAQSTNQPHRQPISLPSNAQLLSMAVLTLTALTLAFVGPDYLAPSLNIWQIQARSASLLYDTSTFTQYMPQYTISKSLWSSAARVGQIAFALFPLCILFALKAPPFALFAIPFVIELYFDKLAWLHRWAGRLIWFLTSIHVVLWSIQLAKDVNPSTGRVAYVHAWSYTPFIYGWIAFALLTLIILLSLKPIRRRFYEHFYILHIIFVPCMLVLAGLHHPTVAGWCWAALLLWFGERLWRGIWWIYANGILGGSARPSTYAPLNFKKSAEDAGEMDAVRRSSSDSTFLYPPTDARVSSPLNTYYFHDKGHISADHDTSIPQAQAPTTLLHSAERIIFTTSFSHSQSPYFPPSGHVHAELLSGRIVRLRLITPGFLPWSPGQHFLLNIPSVSRFTSHPFTCASVCDEEAPTNAGRVMLFLVRTKDGWTRDLWELVSQLTAERSRGDVSPTFSSDALPKDGVLLRAYVDGPFGSAKRTRWVKYSTGIIIAGGSGVSFALSVLQYMCMCLAGRDGRYLGGRSAGWRSNGTQLKRVRFIWLVREYSHVQWCASAIRRCMSIVPPSALQVDIYVTNFKPILFIHPPTLTPARARLYNESTGFNAELEPPRPSFFRESPSHSRSGSADSAGSRDSLESDVDLSYYLGEPLDSEPPADEMRTAHEANILELTNFDGEVDMALPEEAYLSRKVKKEGKLRRMQSRKNSTKDKNQNALSSQLPPHIEVPTEDAQDSCQTSPSQHKSCSRPSRGQLRKIKTTSTQSTVGLLAVSSPSERPNSSSSSMDFSPHPYPAMSPIPSSEVNLLSPSSDDPSSSNPLSYPASGYLDVKPELGKSHAGQEAHSDRVSTSLLETSDSQSPFEMDEHEAMSINAVSEHARPGKPKLDKLIADEVQASKGPIVIACCGPTSLNAIVRKVVAAQIDPGRIRKGDMRGSITLVTEDFEY